MNGYPMAILLRLKKICLPIEIVKNIEEHPIFKMLNIFLRFLLEIDVNPLSSALQVNLSVAF